MTSADAIRLWCVIAVTLMGCATHEAPVTTLADPVRLEREWITSPSSGETREVVQIKAEDFTGRCPVCEQEGHVSRVHVGASWTTAVNGFMYYGELGAFHYCDPNTTTTEYACSRGHVFVTTSRGLCNARAQ